MSLKIGSSSLFVILHPSHWFLCFFYPSMFKPNRGRLTLAGFPLLLQSVAIVGDTKSWIVCSVVDESCEGLCILNLHPTTKEGVVVARRGKTDTWIEFNSARANRTGHRTYFISSSLPSRPSEVIQKLQNS
jgi:hypothetical protein